MPMTRRCLVCGDATRQRQLSECSICWSILQSCDTPSATTPPLSVSTCAAISASLSIGTVHVRLQRHQPLRGKIPVSAMSAIQRTLLYNSVCLFVEKDNHMTSTCFVCAAALSVTTWPRWLSTLTKAEKAFILISIWLCLFCDVAYRLQHRAIYTV